MNSKELRDWQIAIQVQTPLDLKLKTLPLDMPWKDFEHLCVQLAEEENNFENKEITSAMLYGRNGQKQEGIDIKATIPNSNKFFVMQCKRYTQIIASDVEKWVNKFLEGKFSDKTYLYVLATSFDISTDTNLVDAWHKAQQKLDSLGIKSVLWDKIAILNKLKNAYRVTATFFGDNIATGYCHQKRMEEKYPYSYSTKNINAFDDIVYIENRTCRLDLIVPNQSAGIKVGGIFLFARNDLHGTTFSLDGPELVPLMQVKAHSKSLVGTRYLHKNKDKYYLSLGNVRLSLEKDEVDDLDWIIEEAFNRYFMTSKSIDTQLKTKRFERVNSRFKVKISEIKRPLWNAIIKYADAHDISKGNGKDFIFDSAPGCLKVYVDKDTPDLDFGYHLIMYPVPKNTLHSNNIILEWEPLIDIAGQPVDISRRKAWDAEYTYHWLHSTLFPKVYQWVIQQENKPEKGIKRLIGRKKNDNTLPLDDFIINNYEENFRILGTGINTSNEALICINKLQSHFTCYQMYATVEKELNLCVIETSLLLASKLPDLKCNYIKGNLSLGSDSTYKELIKLKQNWGTKSYATSTMLDMALRSLGKLLESTNNLSQYDINCLIENLYPVFKRYEEDLICNIYR